VASNILKMNFNRKRRGEEEYVEEKFLQLVNTGIHFSGVAGSGVLK
jgi:hypothetical protein